MTITRERTVPGGPGSGGRRALTADPCGRPAPVVLAAHGSRDPRSAATMTRLAHRVGRRWPAPVLAAFLDFDEPSVPDALRAQRAGGPPPVVVPALLTSAYHGQVDLPGVLAATRVPVRLAEVLGPSSPDDAPDPLLLAGLRRRLSAMDGSVDGLVLICAGTSHTDARSTVESVAASLSAELDVACVVGYASASAPSAGEAVEAVRGMGARRIAAASYFLAPGRLYETAAASARAAGAVDVAEPLGACDELVRLVLARVAAAIASHATRVSTASHATRAPMASHATQAHSGHGSNW